MSVIAGCCWRDGRAARADDLAVSVAAGAHRASAPVRLHAGGPVAFAAGASSTQSDAGPYEDPPTGLAIVIDGRLDNRAELVESLGCQPDLGLPALILAAYRRLGVAAAARLIGDFAFAIWDAPARRLVCVRDALGQRPLFYGVGPRAVVFGSEPQQVLRHGEIHADVNEAIVAEYLAGGPVCVQETLWRNLYRLPPAHALIVTAGAVSTVRYWDFDPEARVRFRRDEEYAAAFRELFAEAVACRLRDSGPAGVFLSGGIDSSSIAGMASQLAGRGRCAPITALAQTWPGESCDESEYIDAVVTMHDLRAIRLPARPPTCDAIAGEVERYLDTPQYPNGITMDPLRRVAGESGLSVVLTGYGGDDWFTGSASHLTDLIRSGRLLAAGRQWLSDASLPGRGYSRLGLARLALSPFVPAVARPMFRTVAGGTSPALDAIRPEFAKRVALADRLRPGPEPPFATRSQVDMYRIATSAVQVIGDELEDRAAHAAGIDQRHPFNDRRVAEFGFALPEAQRWTGRETKVVIRRGLRDLLPPVVVERDDKAEFSATYVAALEALGGARQFDHLLSEAYGWVVGDVVRRQYDEMMRLYRRADEAYIGITDALWAVTSLELWLKAGACVATKAS
jgi:asparagine synthase (glutamine-hydrolysing)